jgi:hypothetical protein
LRRLLIALGLVAALFVCVLVAAALLLDPDDLRGPLVSTLEQNLGRPVTVGELSLELFPLPGVGVSDVRIAGETADAPPLAEVESIRLQPSLLALLGGQVVVRSLEIRSPRITLPVDAEGTPVAPELGPGSASAPPPSDGEAEAEAEAASGPALAIDSITVEHARVQAGPWLVEELHVDGGLQLDGTAGFDVRADLPGLAKLRGVTVKLSGLLTPPLVVDVDGRLEEADLAALAERLELEGLTGGTGARFAAHVADGEVTGGRIELEGAELHYRTAELELRGPVALVGELGGRFELDLSDAELVVPETLHKPAGGVLRLSGALPASVPPAAVEDGALELASSRLPFRVDLAGKSPVVFLASSKLDLAPLAPWLVDPPEGLSGAIAIESMRVRAEPLALDGSARIERVAVALEGGEAVISGPVKAAGTLITAQPLAVALGDQTFDAASTYDLASGRFTLVTSGSEKDTAAIASVVTGRPDVSGLLALNTDLSGTSDGIETLRGKGRFEIKGGEIQGKSIAEQALGQLAALPMLVGQMRGKDLSAYMQNQFEEVSASYTIGDGKLRSDDLLIVQRGARVELAGSIGLVDGALDMRGRLVLRKELDKELGGSGEGSEKVIPITGVGGTITRPRVKIDQRALSQLASSYLLEGETGKQVNQALEERLGKEGSEAVQGLLKGILGGGQPAPKPPPSDQGESTP